MCVCFFKMVTKVLPIEFGVEEMEESGCIICLKEEKDLPVTSCCGKMVHEKCLLEWIEVCTSPSCPHCREPMLTVSEKNP